MSKKTIWAIVALVGGYIFCQALADVAATKLVSVAGIVIPAGTFVFTVSFTLRDMLHKRLGREWTRAAIVIAGVLNVCMALYLKAMADLPSPVFVDAEAAAAWSDTFALVPSIVIASITAEVVSMLIDTEVYQATMARFTGKMQFMRVIISNAVALPIDSLIFGFLAFMILPPLLGGGTHTFAETLSIAWGQIVWKAAVTAVSLPGIYLVKDRDFSQSLV